MDRLGAGALTRATKRTNPNRQARPDLFEDIRLRCTSRQSPGIADEPGDTPVTLSASMSRAARPDLHHGLRVAATDIADDANETQFQNPPFHAVRLTDSRTACRPRDLRVPNTSSVQLKRRVGIRGDIP
jgi:hypothetical protein